MPSAVAYCVIRFLLGGVFVYAGVTKLAAIDAFADVVGGYGLVPGPFLPWVALLLPVLEVAAGLGLVFDVRGALGAVVGMTVLFMAVLGYGLWLGLDVDCGCYGPEDPGASYGGLRSALWRDAGLLAAGGLLYVLRRATGAKLRSPRPPFRINRGAVGAPKPRSRS